MFGPKIADLGMMDLLKEGDVRPDCGLLFLRVGSSISWSNVGTKL